MEYADVMQRLEDMKSRFQDGFSNIDRQFLDSLHFTLYGKIITQTGCGDCYRDAYLQMRLKLNKEKMMPKKSNYTLKTGAVIAFFGESVAYTNANLTDEVAERYISLNPTNIRLFESFPLNYKERIEMLLSGNKAEETVKVKVSHLDDLNKQLAESKAKEKDYLKQIEDLKAEIDTLKTSVVPKTRKKRSSNNEELVTRDV